MSQQQEVTLERFIAEHGLSMVAAMTNRNPHMAGEMPIGSSHWACVISGPCGESMKVYFSMGPALSGPPSLAEVLDAISSDIASVRNAPDWLDWAEEMGADMEAESLRQLRSAHETITRQGEQLEAIIGYDAIEQLLWDVERL